MANLTITKITPVQEYVAYDLPAGEAITKADVVRIDTSTGLVTKANATTAAEARSIGIACNTAAAGAPVHVVRAGIVDIGDSITALAFDADVYVSDTDGRLADAAGTVERKVGTVIPAIRATGTPDKLLYVDFQKNGVFGGAVAGASLASTGGAITAGADGAVQGRLTLWDGAGGVLPAYIAMASPNGTVHYLFVEDDGTLKVHTAAPTANADGDAVGDQTD